MGKTRSVVDEFAGGLIKTTMVFFMFMNSMKIWPYKSISCFKNDVLIISFPKETYMKYQADCMTSFSHFARGC